MSKTIPITVYFGKQQHVDNLRLIAALSRKSISGLVRDSLISSLNLNQSLFFDSGVPTLQKCSEKETEFLIDTEKARAT